MVSPTYFQRTLCLGICVGLAWFSVVAKPIEHAAVVQRRYTSNLTHLAAMVGTGGVRNGKTFEVENLESLTLVVDTPTRSNHVHHLHASGFKVNNTAPTAHITTW
jgi:hypothetical protein